MTEYRLIRAADDELTLAEAQERMNILSREGYKVIDIATCRGAIIWTMEKLPPRNDMRRRR
mgnify:CR=1 FL=1